MAPFNAPDFCLGAEWEKGLLMIRHSLRGASLAVVLAAALHRDRGPADAQRLGQKPRHRLIGLAVDRAGAHADLQDGPPLGICLPAVDAVNRCARLQFQRKVGDGSGPDKQRKSTPNLDNKSQPGNGSASDASSHDRGR